MRKIIGVIVSVIASILIFGACTSSSSDVDMEQKIYEQTLSLSQEYAVLRYQTDNVLVSAEDYADYDSWNEELSNIIDAWETLETESGELEILADEFVRGLTDENVSSFFNQVAYAYTAQEISNIVDKAAGGKKIMTLANHLGVDAKMAQAILNQAQAQMSRDAYGEEGDVFSECENRATRIKNTAKVTVFVGTVVASGGTAAFAASGAVAQTAVVVAGADLALEITDDEAKIALGDKNKVSEIVGTVRTVTEPAAAILMIASLPQNVTKAVDKLGMAIFTGDQLRSVVQEGKIIGISLKPQESGQLKVEVANLSEEELPNWRSDNNAIPSGETIEEILNIANKDNMDEDVQENNQGQQQTESSEGEEGNLSGEQPQDEASGVSTAQEVAGNYSGSAALQHIEEDVEAPDSLAVTLQLNEAGTGTANVNGYSGEAQYAGSTVTFSVPMEEDGAAVSCVFEGSVSRNGSQIVISGNIYFSMMGVTFASYTWTAQK